MAAFTDRKISKFEIGVFVAVLLVLVVAAVHSQRGSDSSGGSSCQAFKARYTDNPTNPDVGLARQYFRVCGQEPPPVLSGQLNESDVKDR